MVSNVSTMTRFFLVLLIALPFSLFSQDYAGLTKAFSHGDASAIANMFAEQVELSIENDVVSESAIDSQKELRTSFYALAAETLEASFAHSTDNVPTHWRS